MMVFVKTAPMNVAPLVMALRKLALPSKVSLKLTEVRFALVTVTPLRSDSRKDAWLRFAPSKLARKNSESTQFADVMAALTRTAEMRVTSLRFEFARLRLVAGWLRICPTGRDLAPI